MKPDRCTFCRGKISEGKAEFLGKVGQKVLVIKGIPAYVCEDCGEAYYTPEVSGIIDGIRKDFSESKLLLRPIAAGELSFDEYASADDGRDDGRTDPECEEFMEKQYKKLEERKKFVPFENLDVGYRKKHQGRSN
ncbi:type II toxin-antitoxin system MqsA family antitoxin [Methanosarcina sp. KYL-1]|uniref:type II toxin-antitoxin system MqsA family antitoxin n=1 Tax=Methanosarcina sp. KYL-1 TaxID=2602068 RepID=UPI002101092D|nr:type II toxin-antitoxin system MqsA family antitoxin [Methanosarcina sp. KYL-1]MCQ1535562.1 type II toxin-antitoxin system MqsA family antitoxin [Methanosarcina sp. KYL-1]